jgi:hypothetical protein
VRRSPGRNDPCPCGSGRKYKRCCLLKAEAVAHFTREDRLAAFAALGRFSETAVGREDDAAHGEFWDRLLPRAGELGEKGEPFSTDAFDMWFWFDRPLDDGSLVAERLLDQDPSLPRGVRTYLDLARTTGVHLYEVEDVRPGVSLTLRDVLDEGRVTVREQLGSRTIRRAELLAARVIPRGVSGEPEMEAGLLNIPALIRKPVVAQLADWRKKFRRENPGTDPDAFFKLTAPFFHTAWVSSILDPPIPHLQNTDGEDMLLTRVQFAVLDEARLRAALDAGPDLQRDGDRSIWHWVGVNRKNEPVGLALVRLEGATLTLELNSAERAARGRKMMETLAGDAVKHRATTHEDPARQLRERLRAGELDEPPAKDVGELPPEALEDLTLDHYARYYRSWIEEPVPALDDRTPRQAADDPARRDKLIELIRGLEGMYQHALQAGQPAYDPSWMWEELGLAEGPASAHPPPLAHERWAEATPGLGELSRSVAERVRRRPGFDDATSVASAEDLDADLEVRRFLASTNKAAPAADTAPSTPDADADVLRWRLQRMVDFELHRRKSFWVDESLSCMLAQTDNDVVGDELRVPFASFALIFTDRQMLSLAERLLATDRSCPFAGQFLRVLTVYATEESRPQGRTLRFGFAADALGADPPHLFEHELALAPASRVEPRDEGAIRPQATTPDGELVPLPDRRPLPGLMHVVLNAILYATSAGVDPEVRKSPQADRSRAGGAPDKRPAAVSSEEVFFLPGAIEISQVRRIQELQRAPGGRALLHRFMVRGHWRRAAATWKEKHLRWIKPYWKGPDIAAVIERTYKLKP